MPGPELDFSDLQALPAQLLGFWQLPQRLQQAPQGQPAGSCVQAVPVHSLLPAEGWLLRFKGTGAGDAVLVILMKPARWEDASSESSQHKGPRPKQAAPDGIKPGQGVCNEGPQLISRSCQRASGCWRHFQQGDSVLELLNLPLSIL